MPTTFETDPPTPENPDPQPPDGILPPVDVPEFDASINEVFAGNSPKLTKYLAKYPKGVLYPSGRTPGGTPGVPEEAPWLVEDVEVKTNIPPTPEYPQTTVVILHLSQMDTVVPSTNN